MKSCKPVMHNLKIILPAVCLIMLFAGCLVSLNPAYTPETLTMEPGLVGAWLEIDKYPRGQVTPEEAARIKPSLILQEAPGRDYLLFRIEGESSHHTQLAARVVKLGTRVYLDVLVENPEEKQKLQPGEPDELHWIMLIEMERDKLVLYRLDPGLIGKLAVESGVPIDTERQSGDSVLYLTGTTSQVQKLLSTLPREAFGEPMVLRRWQANYK